MLNNYNPFSLQNKIILVTGASSGIGKCVAIECSKMGARVIITGRNEERLDETLNSLYGEGHTSLAADLSTEDGIKYLLNSIPKVDGIVLCAGRAQLTPFNFATREKFDKMFSINLFSPIEILRMIVKKKLYNPGLSVVAISSAAALAVTPANGIYGAGKAALSVFLQYAALELAGKNIRVNSICPSMVNTPMTAPDTVTKEQLEADEQKIPLKRYGEPEDVAYAVIYFLSDASSWVTGNNFIIDGGRLINCLEF